MAAIVMKSTRDARRAPANGSRVRMNSQVGQLRKSATRTPEQIACVLRGGILVAVVGALGLGTMSGPAFAFDGSTTPSTPSLTPKALTALEYAADQGQLAAQWKVGRMYAVGDGVPQDD